MTPDEMPSQTMSARLITPRVLGGGGVFDKMGGGSVEAGRDSRCVRAEGLTAGNVDGTSGSAPAARFVAYRCNKAGRKGQRR